MINHTFAICAYKESPYLEKCVQSLINQDDMSKIIICTATLNKYISDIAEKYNIEVFANDNKPGIGSDWNFALGCCQTKYVTIAHQDDIYFPEYSKLIVNQLENNNKSLIGFSDYSEIRNDKIVNKNKILKIKRFMNFPIKLFSNSRFIRNRIISFGNSICCPSVTYNTDAIKDFTFDISFKCNLDWDAWSRLAKMKGSFVYINKPLMGHRVHEESETTALLDNGVRFNEDMQIFKRYHPLWFCNLINKQYKKSADSNKVTDRE